jgi:glycosyltransferase involved in cell wall biosynthesis
MNFFRNPPLATVAINLVPRRGSWGGANQWTSQVTRYLENFGYRVRYDLKRSVDAIVMTHTGLSRGVSFDAGDVAGYLAREGQVPVIHRINDNDIRKGTSEMDAYLAVSNEVASHTVFVSEWLRDHHAKKWFDATKPHSVIEAGADPAVFHPLGNCPPGSGDPLRIVTHHWSDNWSKGFDVYQEIDELIASGAVKGFELWIIGRWPKELIWKSARTHAPASGRELAALLRQCHLYVSASRFEPGAMHPVEGLQCGLPLIAHPDSGGTLTMGQRYGVVLGDSLAATLAEVRERYLPLRNTLLAEPPSGDLMGIAYRRLLQRLLATS